jgi:hypothetical protein
MCMHGTEIAIADFVVLCHFWIRRRKKSVLSCRATSQERIRRTSLVLDTDKNGGADTSLLQTIDMCFHC